MTFLVIVTPDNGMVKNSNEWAGTVTMLRKTIDETEERLTESYNKKISQVKDLVIEQKTRQTTQN